MSIKDKLKNLIEKSNLSQKQKEVWLKFIEVTPEIWLGSILSILEEEPEQLGFLTENLESKLEGFQKKDQNILDEVLKKEKEYLEKPEKN